MIHNVAQDHHLFPPRLPSLRRHEGVINRVAESIPIQIEEIDISASHELEERTVWRFRCCLSRKEGGEIPAARGGIAPNPGSQGRTTGRRGRRGRIGKTNWFSHPAFPAPPAPPAYDLYLAVIMKCPRRFCCQQASFFSVQNGCSLPLLTIVMRLAGTPRFTR